MTGPASAETDCRLGVLAFGDSITNGGGELQWGVALQSWALWVARGLALPFTCYAVDGARVLDVVERQIPAFERLTGVAAARYRARMPVHRGQRRALAGLGPRARSRRRSVGALQFLCGRCDRVLAVTAPLDLGRPRAGAKVEDLNDVVSRVAGELGTLLLDLRSWGARNLVMTDHVHPTAFGQIDIAERALAVLAGAGMRVEVQPSSLISYSASRRAAAPGRLDVRLPPREGQRAVGVRAAGVGRGSRRCAAVEAS